MSVRIPPPPAVCTGFFYTVVRGDTLFFIARRFGVSLPAVIAANPQIVNPNLIYPGQVICVPALPAPIPTIECCMLLFRTALVPPFPEPEAGGVARVYQVPGRDGNVLVAGIGLPDPQTFRATDYVAWVRRPDFPFGFQLRQTGPPVLGPGVWVGAIDFGRDQFAPFQDIIVTAEVGPPFIRPNLNRIVLIGRFAQCRPQ